MKAKNNKSDLCSYCKKPVYFNEELTRIENKIYHKSCFRKKETQRLISLMEEVKLGEI
jgi:hypothetical protein